MSPLFLGGSLGILAVIIMFIGLQQHERRVWAFGWIIGGVAIALLMVSIVDGLRQQGIL